MAIKQATKKDNIPKIGVIYARYSSHNQREESIEQQIDECTAYANANGIKILRVYADKAVSGKSDVRAQFQKMMRDAKKLEFNVVISYKSNRISRNMLHALSYENKLIEQGIKTVYAKEEYGDSAAGRFALRSMMNVNQFYSENMAEDIKRGMANNAAECKVNGVLPYGYKKGANNKYEINEPAAAVVREIYNRYLNGEALIDIANSLNVRGIKTRLGNKWNKGSFHNILTNDAYIGVYRHSGYVIEDGVPPIIEKEVFWGVQKLVTQKQGTKKRHTEYGDYLLTGKLFCGLCESNMVGISGTSRSGKKHFYYACQGHRERSCDKSNVRRDWIESLVAERTIQFILQDDVINWIADNAMEFQKDAIRNSGLGEMENQLSEYQKSAKNLLTLLEQGMISDITKNRLMEIEIDIKNLEREIAIAKGFNKPIERDRIIFSLEQLRDGDIESKSFQKQLIDIFVRAVYINEDYIRIDYYYTGKDNVLTIGFEKDNEKLDIDAKNEFVLAPLISTITLKNRLTERFLFTGDRKVTENYSNNFIARSCSILLHFKLSNLCT